MGPVVRFCWLDGADTALGLPTYATAGAAGADIRANFPSDLRDAGMDFDSGARAVVPTGLSLQIPEGFEVQIRPRSGLALKYGITLPNAPGTIDSDYRGPLGVILQNTGSDPFHIAHGDRIAQMVIAPVVQGRFEVVAKLGDTERGTGGFGSTGTR